QEGNVALGKPYSMRPAPNYGLCTDDGDSEQLTDGQRADASAAQLWANVGCVGWKALEPVEVVIDLGRTHAIDSIVLSSGASPAAEVYLPSAILGVSDAPEDFRVVHRIDSADAGQLARRALRADGLATRGRYVLVRLHAPYGSYVFLDEIQVLSGGHDPDQVRLPDDAIAPLETDARSERQKRLARALDRLQLRAGEAGLQAAFAERITVLREEVDQAPTTPDGKLLTIAPEIIAPLNERARALQGEVVRAIHTEERLAIWDVSPWAEVLPTDVPPLGRDLRELKVVAGRNEYESQAFMVTNLGDQARSIQVRLGGRLARPRGWGGSVILRRTVFVEPMAHLVLGDALALLDAPVAIPAWESRQVWLEIHTGDAALGTHRGSIVVTDDVGDEYRIGLKIEVLPVAIPDDVPIATYSWQYVDSIATLKGIEAEAVADLAAHYSNVSILSNNCLPRPNQERGEIDADGNITVDLDFSALDRWIELLRPVSGQGMGWFPTLKFTGEIDEESPEYRTYSQWVRRWMAHLKELGLDYGDFFVYPVDESIRANFVASGKAIRSVDPKIRIFADPMMRDRDEFLLAAAPYVDIWCPSLTERRPHLARQMDILRQTNKPVWSYMVGRRVHHPYSAYRLALWRAFELGASGCGFWCYAVGEGWKSVDMWHESPWAYAAVYTLDGAPEDVSRAEAIIPSKRWEAWREGIEDYTHLHVLRSLIDQHGQPSSDQVTEAQEVLETAIQTVLTDPDDITRADAHRERVLRAIVALRVSGPGI
ncbi:MAG TPA: hypothetical protein QGH10_21755, partial [Armatimonadota bacterium]|nr:hypothetical protein [Armatimonadota bacterium]